MRGSRKKRLLRGAWPGTRSAVVPSRWRYWPPSSVRDPGRGSVAWTNPEEELATAKETLARHTATFPDFVLHGRAPNGEDVRIKVNGDALARAEDGQVIGRSAADANHVLGVESVSRRHARLRVDGVSLTVEDLGSLNGTQLNGTQLVKGTPMTASAGSTLALGGVTLTVHFPEGRG